MFILFDGIDMSMGVALGQPCPLIGIGILGIMLSIPASTTASLPGPSLVIVSFYEVPHGIEPGSSLFGGRVKSINLPLRHVDLETSDPAGVMAATRADERVRYAVENRAVTVLAWNVRPAGPPGSPDTPGHVPNDPLFTQQYGLPQVSAPQGWLVSLGSTSAAVCVVDTGARLTHQDLVGPRYGGGYDFVDDDPDPTDPFTGIGAGHGTRVLGVAAATTDNNTGIAGMAQAKFFVVRSIKSASEAEVVDLRDGILWCADNAGLRVVINGSWALRQPEQPVTDAIDYAYNTKGNLLVFGAGNLGLDPDCFNNCIVWPASRPEIVAVTGTTAGELSWPTSSRGPHAVAAPADSILSTAATSDSSYLTASGTSFAAPLVSGAAAILWTLEPSLTNLDLRNRLRSTAEDLGDPGHDPRFGYGELDLNCLLGNTVPCV